MSAQEDTSPRFIDQVSGQGVVPLLGLGFPGRIRVYEVLARRRMGPPLTGADAGSFAFKRGVFL